MISFTIGLEDLISAFFTALYAICAYAVLRNPRTVVHMEFPSFHSTHLVSAFWPWTRRRCYGMTRLDCMRKADRFYAREKSLAVLIFPLAVFASAIIKTIMS